MFCFKVSKKYVSKELAKEIHAKAAPFVKWLKEAEEESEGSEAEEEEDDENVEVIYYTFFFFHFFTVGLAPVIHKALYPVIAARFISGRISSFSNLSSLFSTVQCRCCINN